jgi:Protein of unknown function (DUF3298)/Deacetylase PdaC
MKFLPITFFFCSTFVFLACTNRQNDSSLVLSRQHFSYDGSYRCDTITSKGVTIGIDYILLDATNNSAAKSVNDTLRAMIAGSVSGWLDSAAVAQNPQARTNLALAANLFADEYKQFTNDLNGIVGGCWELKIRADTMFSNQRVLTTRLESYAYTGGAHPNTYVWLRSFDRASGQPIELIEMVKDTARLLPVVERAFRQKMKLGPKQDLENAGYFLKNGRFFLPENIALGRTGLICYYNPYEIAAYALGPIEVIVPYSALGSGQ